MMIDRLAGNAALKDSVRLMLGSRRLTHSVLLVGETGLGAGRDIGRRAVGGFGLLDLRRVTAADLDIVQADLGFAVAQLCQLLVVLRGGGGVAPLEGFIGQALVGQAGATGQCDGQCQQRHRSQGGASFCGSWLACDGIASVLLIHLSACIAGKPAPAWVLRSA